LIESQGRDVSSLLILWGVSVPNERLPQAVDSVTVHQLFVSGVMSVDGSLAAAIDSVFDDEDDDVLHYE